MPTRRMIEPAIWQSESMGRLTIRQRLLFIGIFSNADDQGRLRASAPVIRSMVFPFDDIELSDIESDILAIEHESCIMLYGSNGSRFAQVINWWVYQTPQWAYPSKIPKADGWSDRLRFRHGGKVVTENWQTEKTFSQTPSIDQNRIEVPKAIGKGLGKDKPILSPNGDSATTPEPIKKQTPRQHASEVLELRFSELSGLPLPKRDTDKERKAGAARWWNPLLELWSLCDNDTDNAIGVLEKAYRKMQADELTISAPQSVLEVAKSIYARNGSKPNGRTTGTSGNGQLSAEDQAISDILTADNRAREIALGIRSA